MLENTMTATLNGETLEFDTDFGRSEARRITFDYFVGRDAEGKAIELQIKVGHYQRGEYTVRVDRHKRSHDFVEFRVMKDSLKAFRVSEGARYSSKKLEEVAAYWFEKLTSSEGALQTMIDWALEEVVEPRQ